MMLTEIGKILIAAYRLQAPFTEGKREFMQEGAIFWQYLYADAGACF
jgi:hypothetical protein